MSIFGVFFFFLRLLLPPLKAIQHIDYKITFPQMALLTKEKTIARKDPFTASESGSDTDKDQRMSEKDHKE